MVEFWKISGWYWPIFDLVAFIFVAAKFRSYLFGKFLTFGFLIGFLLGIFYRIENMIEFYPSYQWLFSSVSIFSALLVLIGITSITIPSSTPNEISSSIKELLATQLSFKVRSLPTTFLLMIITLNIYWIFWLYHNVKELRQLESNKLSFTPGQAVGLLFVPLFNLYWFVRVFIRLPQAIKFLKDDLQATLFGANYAASVFSTIFILSIVTNGIIARFNLSFFFVGGILLLTAILVTQHHINEIWRKVQHMQESL